MVLSICILLAIVGYKDNALKREIEKCLRKLEGAALTRYPVNAFLKGPKTCENSFLN